MTNSIRRQDVCNSTRQSPKDLVKDLKTAGKHVPADLLWKTVNYCILKGLTTSSLKYYITSVIIKY